MPGYPEHLRELIDRQLAALRFSESPVTAGLEDAMRYSLLAGGKRVRPVLCLATGRAVGLEPESLIPAAVAIELIHTYSLIHDDLPAMDDDDLRRGRPTLHRAKGEDVAILAGDGLFAEAIRIFSTEQRGESDRVLAALGELCAATGVDGMVGGQYLDVTDAASAPDSGVELPDLHGRKTGRLIAASVGVPLRIAAADESVASALRRFSAALGLLFQIVDDILDVTGSDAELGKPRGSDERHGKLTYVSSYGLDRAREMADQTHATAIDSLDRVGAERTADLRAVADFIHEREA
ncbi:polyprenyl synthetase family protein [Thermoleophilia bacterium SCSIO 60948]|nr:polyprenyl synthetase family protein [Thermoleophilia bacterium SCSIO 60948]